jgi:hypothetical protein
VLPRTGRSRSGVSSPPTRAALVRTSSVAASPVRFYALAEQSAAARCGGRAGVVIRSAIDDHSSMTKFPSSFRSSCGWARGNRAITLTDDPTTSERLRFIPPSEPGVMHRRGSFGAVFRYPLTARTFAAWPDDWVLPSSSPGGAHGVLAVTPFAGLLPRGGWPVRFRTLPGPRVVRADSAAPIYFRRGDPSFARGSETLASDRKRAKANRGRVGVRLLGFNSRLRSARRHARTGLVVRWCARGGLRSCLGLSLSQGFGHDLPCTVRARPGTIHQPPAGCRRTHRRRADPSARLTRLGALERPSRPTRAGGTSAIRESPARRHSRRRRPALQRVRGADALPLRHRTRARVAAAPCMRFSHRP